MPARARPAWLARCCAASSRRAGSSPGPPPPSPRARTPLGALAHLVPAGALDSPATLFHATQTALLERAGRARRRPALGAAPRRRAPPGPQLVGAARQPHRGRLGPVAPHDALRRAGPEAIAALRAADEARILTLGSLDAIAIDTLLHRVLGGPLDGVAEVQLLAHQRWQPPLPPRTRARRGRRRNPDRGVGRVAAVGTFSTTEALGERVLGRMSTLADASRDALN